MEFRFLARRKIRIRITVCQGDGWLILLVAFRPGDHVREIERPHDLEPIATHASFWRIRTSPAGPGDVLYLKSELTEDH